MVKIIMGLNGSGKTRKLVDMVRETLAANNGDVIVVENEDKLKFDIPYQARLIDASQYDSGSYGFMKGLICGIHASNYDVSHIFIDNFSKIVGSKDGDQFADFIAWLNDFSARENVNFVISTSGDPEFANESIKAYIV